MEIRKGHTSIINHKINKVPFLDPHFWAAFDLKLIYSIKKFELLKLSFKISAVSEDVYYKLFGDKANLEIFTNSIFYFLSTEIKCRFSFLDDDNNTYIFDINASYIN